MSTGETTEKPAGSHENQATETFAHVAAELDPLLGQMAGNYHLLSRAGEGGFGSVYRARDVKLDRLAAVKFLRVGDTPGARTQFEREARALAKLGQHPGVVDVYAWGEHAGQYYIAMEYVAQSAAGLLSSHPQGLPVRDALHIVLRCAEALKAAHAAGVLHGDIKPSNILLDGAPAHAKLCDFGLTQLGPDPHSRALSGSPAYMAPERAQGGPLTEACDIFALGATLEALLTGGALLSAASLEEALAKAAAGEREPLAKKRPDLPKPVTAVVEKALAKDLSQRFVTSVQFSDAVRVALDTLDAKPERKPTRTASYIRRLSFAAAFLILALGGVMLSGEFSRMNGGGSVVLADARLHLNQGDYDTARSGFEEYLNSHPEDAEARYGLAYAFLLEGEQQRAAEEFARVGEAALRAEGQAAVAYMQDGEEARPAIEKASAEAGGGYAEVLLAMLDVMSGDYKEAQARLSKLSAEHFPFDWQRRQYLQTLGQVQFKQGDYAAAQKTFDQLTQESAGSSAVGTMFASDYAEISRREMESAERVEVSAQVARLKSLLAESPATPLQDTWTSRPLRVWIPPVTVRSGVVAQETGLADILPWRLSRALLEDPQARVAPVERGAMAEVLAEQELASQLGGDGAVRLGQVLGARLLLQMEVTRVFQEETVNVSLVDTETTRLTPVGEYGISRDMDPAIWVKDMVRDLQAAVEKSYPIRGRLLPAPGGAKINIGADAGVSAGMVFNVLAGPAASFRLDGVTARVGAELAPAEATVQLEGADAATIPAEGWHVERAPGKSDAEGRAADAVS